MLNRVAASEIQSQEPSILNVDDSALNTTQNREELLQLQTATAIQRDVQEMTRLFWMPRISGFIDLGAQGEQMKYNRNANYYLLGV